MSQSKSYARILMNTSGGIIEVIGLALEFPSMLYLLRDACISACNTLESLPDILKNGTSSVNFTGNENYIYSLGWMATYFTIGILCSKFGNWVQSDKTISLVESMIYSKSKLNNEHIENDGKKK